MSDNFLRVSLLLRPTHETFRITNVQQIRDCLSHDLANKSLKGNYHRWNFMAFKLWWSFHTFTFLIHDPIKQFRHDKYVINRYFTAIPILIDNRDSSSGFVIFTLLIVATGYQGCILQKKKNYEKVVNLLSLRQWSSMIKIYIKPFSLQIFWFFSIPFHSR